MLTPAAQPSVSDRVGRAIWNAIWLLLYLPSPRCCHGWRRFLLRLFGASIDPTAHPYPRARIWAPWNLTMEESSCLADNVDCYCVNQIKICRNAVVSQHSHLCGGSHDYNDPRFPLVTGPIEIGQRAWVAAGAFIGPGVRVGEGAVVGARATVCRDVPPWTVVAGNPARSIGTRNIGGVTRSK